jgi:hypothetical protein
MIIGCKTVLQKITQTNDIEFYIYNPTPSAPPPPAAAPPAAAPPAAAPAAAPPAAATPPPGALPGTPVSSSISNQILLAAAAAAEAAKNLSAIAATILRTNPQKAIEYADNASLVLQQTMPLLEVTEPAPKRQKLNKGGNKGGNGSEKMKEKTNISNTKFMDIVVEYLYEISLQTGKNYFKQLLKDIKNILSGKTQVTKKEFNMDMKLVANMKRYLKDIHILKYGYSDDLQYTVLRFLELSNIKIDGIPFTMENYTTWIRNSIEEYMEKKQKAQTRQLPQTAAMAIRERENTFYPLQKSIKTGGNSKKKPITKTDIATYEKDLVKLYKSYIRLAKTDKPEQELQEEFQKLDHKIQKLAHKIKIAMEK